MSVMVYNTAEKAGTAAAILIAAEMIAKPYCVLGMDSSGRLMPCFDALREMSRGGLCDWSDVTVVGFSERLDVTPEEKASAFLDRSLLRFTNQPEDKRLLPPSGGENWSIACSDYEDRIAAIGGMDIALAAVEPDGSLFYNFGSEMLAPVTHVERAQEGRVITVGIGTLMQARKLVILMTGEEMAETAKKVLNAGITPALPASYLRMHGDVVFLLDESAAAGL